MKREACIIGAGASGLIAAIEAARRGLRVTLFEKNPKVGRKLAITGKGRCNLTNDSAVPKLIDHIPVGGRFLYSAFAALDAKATMAYFEDLGLSLKVERGGRVFPASDRAYDVVDALHRECRRLGVNLVFEEVLALAAGETAPFVIQTAAQTASAGVALIATGGLSYPLTGSTGDGYRFAKAFGHTIVSPKASLVGLVSPGTLCSRLQGLSLRNVRLTVLEGEKPIFEDLGEMLFTHDGVSGPLVLSASARMRAFDKGHRLSIDLKPGLDDKKLDARLLADFAKAPNREMGNALFDLLPRSLVLPVLEQSGIESTLRVHSLTAKQRASLVRVCKGFAVPVSGTRPIEEAVVTSGGVDVREVSPKTMESKRVPGLFFAGELLDVDGYTGGYNLQIAWSTGFAAGRSMAQALLPPGSG